MPVVYLPLRHDRAAAMRQRREQVHLPASTVPGAAQSLAVNSDRLGLPIRHSCQPVTDDLVEAVGVELLQYRRMVVCSGAKR